MWRGGPRLCHPAPSAWPAPCVLHKPRHIQPHPSLPARSSGTDPASAAPLPAAASWLESPSEGAWRATIGMRSDPRHSPPSACNLPQGRELSRSILPQSWPSCTGLRTFLGYNAVVVAADTPRSRRHSPCASGRSRRERQQSSPPTTHLLVALEFSLLSKRAISRKEVGSGKLPRVCPPSHLSPRLVPLPWSPREKPASRGSAFWPYVGDQQV